MYLPDFSMTFPYFVSSPACGFRMCQASPRRPSLPSEGSLGVPEMSIKGYG